MADQKISQLTPDTSPTGDDLVVIVNDPGVTPANKSATINNVGLGMNVPCCSIVLSTPHPITNGTPTVVQFDGADVYDTDTMHNPSSNNTRITFTTAGVYLLTCAVEFQSDASVSGLRAVNFKVNGSTTLSPAPLFAPQVISSGYSQLTTAIQYKFAANQYAEVVMFQNSGGDLNVTAATAQACRIAIG